MTALSRRSFLVLSAGGAATLALSACGDDGGSGGTSTKGMVAVQMFKDGTLAPGDAVRLPLTLGDQDGPVATGGPQTLTTTIIDAQTGKQVGGAVTAQRHAEGVPRPYWPFVLQLPSPGLYTGKLQIDGGTADWSFSITDPKNLLVPYVGGMLPSVDTPTVTDKRGVDPICTAVPPCALHEVSVADALTAGKPLVLLIGTPAYCQTGVCGPMLDLIIEQQKAFADQATFIHCEVYAVPFKDANTPVAPIVATYQLEYEPVVYLVKADGTIQQRLDVLADRAELKSAITALVGA